MKKLHLENSVDDISPVFSNSTQIFPPVPPSQTLPPALNPFNNGLQLPLTPSIKENNQENEVVDSHVVSNDQVAPNDYFAKINKAKAALDMSDWPTSLT